MVVLLSPDSQVGIRTGNMSYLQQFTTEMAPETSWNNRFTLGQIPEYNALNDRYCKFWKRGGRKGTRRNQGHLQQNSWSPDMGKMYGESNYYSPVMPMSAAMMPDGPQLAFQQPAPPNHRIPPPPERVPREAHDSLNMTDPSKPDHVSLFQDDAHQHAHTLPAHQIAEAVSPPHPSQLLTMHDLKRPHRVNRNTRQLPQNQVHEGVDHGMHNRRNQSIQVEKCIEIREGFLYLLQEISERPINGPQEKDSLAKELQQIISPLRSATLDTIEAIQKWAHLSSLAVQDYQWKGVSYIIKLQTDLNFIAHSEIASLLDFVVTNNPLLQQLQSDSKDGNNNLAKDLPPVKQGREPAGLTKADPLGERLAAAERVLMTCPISGEEEIEEEGYLQFVSQESPVPPPQTDATLEAIPEDDWLTRTEDRSKEIEERAAINIQRVYRGFRDKVFSKAKLRQRHAAIVMQKLARRICADREVRGLSTKRNAARKLQSLQRGIFSRGEVRRMRQERVSAMEIQRVFRGHLGRHIATDRTIERDAATTIQSAWQGYNTRRTLKDCKTKNRQLAAMLIQKHWRGRLVRTDIRYNKEKIEACLRIQRWVRGEFGRQDAHKLRQQRNACLSIQSWARGNATRKSVKELQTVRVNQRTSQEIACYDEAATKVQSVWRMHSAQKSVQTELKTKREEAAATSIQARFRGNDTRQSQENQKLQAAREIAAVKIQSQVRRRQAGVRVNHLRGVNEKAKCIQRVERGRQARKIASERQRRYSDDLKEKVAQSIVEEEAYKKREEQYQSSKPCEDTEGKSPHSEKQLTTNTDTAVPPSPIEQYQEDDQSADEQEDEEVHVDTPASQTEVIDTTKEEQTHPGIEPARSESVLSEPEQETPQSVPSSPIETLADFVGSNKKNYNDTEHVQLLLAIAKEEKHDSYGLRLLNDVVENVTEPDNLINSTTPRVSSKEETQLGTNEDAEVIQRSWRKHHSKELKNKKVYLQRCKTLAVEREAIKQERVKAATILQSFYKIVNARNQAHERKQKKESRGMGQAKIAVAHERAAAVGMIQNWTRVNVSSKKVTRSKVLQKEQQAKQLSIEAVDQERQYSAQIIQRGARMRLARNNVKARKNTYSSDRRLEELRSCDQERSYSISEIRQVFIEEQGVRSLILDDESSHYYVLQSSLIKLPLNLLQSSSENENLSALESLLQAGHTDIDSDDKLTFLSTLGEAVGMPLYQTSETDAVESEIQQEAVTDIETINESNSPVAVQESTSPVIPPTETFDEETFGSGVALSYLLSCASDDTRALTVLQRAVSKSESGQSESESPQLVENTSPAVVPSEVQQDSPAAGIPATDIPAVSPVEDTISETPIEVAESPAAAEVTQQEAAANVTEEEGGAVTEEPQFQTPSTESIENRSLIEKQERERIAAEIQEKYAREFEVREQQEAERLAKHENKISELQKQMLEMETKIAQLEEKKATDDRRIDQSIAQSAESDKQHQDDNNQRIVDRATGSVEYQKSVIRDQEKRREAAAIVIQSKQRQVAARETTSIIRKEQAAAAEAAFREEEDEVRQNAASQIQRGWTIQYPKLKAQRITAVTKIQALFRGFTSRNRATNLQRERDTARQQKAERDALADKSAVEIQRTWRGTQGRTEANEKKQIKMQFIEVPAAECIQRSWRSMSARDEAKRRRINKDSEKDRSLQQTRQHNAASTIQRAWRCYNARFEVGWRREAKANKSMKSREDVAATKIQSQFRGKQARDDVTAQRKEKHIIKTKKLQNEQTLESSEEITHQQEQLQREQHEEDVTHNGAAIVIQRAYRCYNAKFMLLWKRDARHNKREAERVAEENAQESHAATSIQCMYRSRVAKHELKSKRTHRAETDKVKTAEEERLEGAAITIQCAYRRYNSKFEASWRRERKTALQDLEQNRKQAETRDYELQLAKTRVQRERELRRTEAALCIQCAWRVYNARFQSAWMAKQRGDQKAARARSVEEDKAVRVIQRGTRCHLARNETSRRATAREEARIDKIEKSKQEHELLVGKSATTIQCMVRSSASRRTVNRRRLSRDEKLNTLLYHERRTRAAIKIQCLYRCRTAKFEAEYRRLVGVCSLINFLLWLFQLS